MPSDPSRRIAALARDRINLDLKTLDLCFLAGHYLRADRASLASFEEDVLIDMFEQVCDVVPRCQDRCRLPLGSFMCVWGIMGAGGAIAAAYASGANGKRQDRTLAGC
jgi:hypothetical protein